MQYKSDSSRGIKSSRRINSSSGDLPSYVMDMIYDTCKGAWESGHLDFDLWEEIAYDLPGDEIDIEEAQAYFDDCVNNRVEYFGGYDDEDEDYDDDFDLDKAYWDQDRLV